MNKRTKTQRTEQQQGIEDLLHMQLCDDYVKRDNKKIYYYSMQLFNTDLMLPLALDHKIEELSVKLSTLPVQSFQFFTNDLPVDLSHNIEHKATLKAFAFKNQGQQRLLEAIHQDYLAMDSSTQHAHKEILFVCSFDKDEVDIQLPIVDEMFATFGAKKLNRSEIVQTLRVYLTRNMKQITDDTYVPNRIHFISRHYQIDNAWRKVWVIRKYPNKTEHASFAPLIQLPNTHVSFHLKRNNNNTQKLINKLGRQSQIQRQSAKLSDALDGADTAEGAKQLYEELNGGNSALFDTTIFVEMVAESRDALMKQEKKVEAQLAFLNVKVDKLLMRQQDGFLSMLPVADNRVPSRSHPFTSRSFSALFPFSYTSKNDVEGVLLGQIAKGSNMIVDFFNRGDNQLNGNLFIAGQQGGGKTIQLLNVCLQYIAYGHQIFTLDPEGDIGRTLEKVGAINTNVASGQFKINFLEVREFGTDEGEVEITDFEVILSNHISWVKRFLKTYKPTLRADILDVIEHYLAFFYHEQKIYDSMQDGIFPIASTFYDYIENNEALRAVRFITEEQHNEVLLALHSICRGVDSLLFDGQTNVTHANAVNFDIQSLLTGSQERTHASLFNIITYIFTLAVKKRNETLNKGLKTKDIPPTILAVDELYLLFDNESPEIAIELRNLLKRDRKYNFNMINATQNLIDLLQKKLIDYTLPIISNSNKKLLLNPGLAEVDIVQKEFKLSDKETSKIIHAKRGEFLFIEGKEKYFVQSEGYLLPSIEELVL